MCKLCSGGPQGFVCSFNESPRTHVHSKSDTHLSLLKSFHSCYRCLVVLFIFFSLQEHAFESSQKYKEGKFIIELAHMIKDNNWEWHLPSSGSPCLSPSQLSGPLDTTIKMPRKSIDISSDRLAPHPVLRQTSDDHHLWFVLHLMSWWRQHRQRSCHGVMFLLIIFYLLVIMLISQFWRPTNDGRRTRLDYNPASILPQHSGSSAQSLWIFYRVVHLS